MFWNFLGNECSLNDNVIHVSNVKVLSSLPGLVINRSRTPGPIFVAIQESYSEYVGGLAPDAVQNVMLR